MFSAFRVFVVDGEKRQDSASTSAHRCSRLKPTSRLGSTGSSCLVTPRPHSDKSLPPCDHGNRPGTSCSLIYATSLSKEREREGGFQTGDEEEALLSDSLSTSGRLPDWRKFAELISNGNMKKKKKVTFLYFRHTIANIFF